MSAVLLTIVSLASAGLVTVGWLGLVGRLPRNHVAGIRTRFTMASDENWERTHRAAAPFLIFGGVAGLMAGLAFLPFAAAGALSDGVGLTSSMAVAMLIAVSSIAGWFVGTRAARSAPPPSS